MGCGLVVARAAPPRDRVKGLGWKTHKIGLGLWVKGDSI